MRLPLYCVIFVIMLGIIPVDIIHLQKLVTLLKFFDRLEFAYVR